MLSRTAILEADDLPCEKVQIPEWDGFVFVRTMTASEKVDFSKRGGKDEDEDEDEVGDFLSRLAAIATCNEKRELLFTEDDIEALGKKNGVAIERIVVVAQRLNGMGAKAQEELEKNLESAPTSDAT